MLINDNNIERVSLSYHFFWVNIHQIYTSIKIKHELFAIWNIEMKKLLNE